MSPRVESAIRELEDRNEILVSWVEAGIIAFLGILYFLAPKGFEEGGWFEPVPVVLALYAPFIGIRLFLAYRKLLKPAFLYLSIFLDALMMCTLIWSYHLQYQQPASFSLKAPSFTYLYIFIALRCLRYERRYVLAAGLSAIVGWSALLLYAIKSGGTITHNFTKYIVGTDILVGAEVDKMICLGLVTGILAFGVSRARRLLANSVEETQQRAQLTRFFSPQVADRILDAQTVIAPGTGELKNATILSIDLRGFSKLSAELSPNEIMTLLSEYHERMVGIIFKNHGCVDKYMGDGILAHFGVATSTSRPVADALTSIDEMIAEAHRWNTERARRKLPLLQFGFSCNVGNLVFGAVGNREKLELTVIGDAVNLAAKLEKHNKKAGAMALTTRQTLDSAVRQGYRPGPGMRVLTGEKVDGVPYPVDLVVLADAVDPEVVYANMTQEKPAAWDEGVIPTDNPPVVARLKPRKAVPKPGTPKRRTAG